MRSATLDIGKVHQYNVDERFFCFHSAIVLLFGQIIVYRGQEYRIKEIIKNQPSRYYKKHYYYEIRV